MEDEKKKRKEESSNKIIEKEGKTELLDFFTTSFLSENKEKKKE